MVLSPLFPFLTIVGFGGKPAEMSQALINAIKGRLEHVTLSPGQLQEGTDSSYNGGGLAGLEAVFVREMTDRNKVLLLWNTLGIHATLTMSIDHVSLSHAL